VGEVRVLPVGVQDVRLADAVKAFLDTIGPANTCRGYAVALNRLCRDFGKDGATTKLDPDRVAGWFTFAWGDASPQTFNVRLAGLRAAFDYWRMQGWLAGDPLVRLVVRAVAPDDSRALTRAQVGAVLALEVALRERVLWHLLYETAARAEEVLMLDVPHLDTANRRAVVTRKGGARDVIVWQTGAARLLPRMLAGRRTGPLFLTDRRAKPSVATLDVDSATGRARLSYRRAAELFGGHTAGIAGGPFTLHQLRHSALTHAAEDGASTPMLMKMSGHTSVRSLAKYARPSAEALARWRAETDPAARGRR
jgi:integrase/recombinase XerC/integrase/recombinase XerD